MMNHIPRLLYDMIFHTSQFFSTHSYVYTKYDDEPDDDVNEGPSQQWPGYEGDRSFLVLNLQT